MSDAAGRGYTVTEIAPVDQPINVSPESTAAFVGRALRGPLNTPVLLHHFGEFRRRFGDCWSRSSLGPAVRQFFEHGGKNLYVVRVANNARGALLCLPASGSALVLRAIEPGSTEKLRAAVDYDGIDDDNEECFNLTVQRVDPDTGMIVDQEIFPNLSYIESADNFVADLLLSSEMVRTEQPYPQHRPEATLSSDSRYDLAWVDPVQDGTDGMSLSNYDLIGSRRERSGIFALEQVEHFDVLYLPPRGRGSDTGPAAILAAEMYCRRRNAMLIVDPCAEWETADDAVRGVRELGYACPNSISYFPRMQLQSRSGVSESIAPDAAGSGVAGGALAGLLCKLDRLAGPWQNLNAAGLGLRPPMKPAREIDAEDAYTLARAGINPLVQGPAGRARVAGSVTMARGSESHRVFTSLPVRRLCLRVVNTIDLATRWAVFEKPDRKLTARLRGQILTYLACLYELGGLATDEFVVQCDAGLTSRQDHLQHGVTILLVFHPAGSPEPVSFTLQQTALGCRVFSTAFAPAST